METKIQESKYGLVVSSRDVAEQLGKRHDNVIRDLESILETSNLSSLIIPSFYKVDGQNRQYKEYLLTKDGFTLYMFNIRGYNDFKIAYIQKFNEMEEHIRQTQQFHSNLISELETHNNDDWGIDRSVKKLLAIKKREDIIIALKEQNDKDIKEIEDILKFKKGYAWSNFLDFKVKDIANSDKKEIETYVEKDLLPNISGEKLDKFIEKAIEHFDKR